MTKEEYIEKCGSKTAKGLSSDQIIAYFLEGHGGTRNQASAMFIKEHGGFNVKFDRAKAVAMLRQAFEKEKVLEINFVDGEGVVWESNNLSTSHFTMKFRKSETI